MVSDLSFNSNTETFSRKGAMTRDKQGQTTVWLSGHRTESSHSGVLIARGSSLSAQASGQTTKERVWPEQWLPGDGAEFGNSGPRPE